MVRRSVLLAIFAASVSFPAAGASGVYFWRDASGRVNYSDVCPAGVTCVSGGRAALKTVATTDGGSTPQACQGNGRKKCEPAPAPAPSPTPTPTPTPAPEPTPAPPPETQSGLRSAVGTNLDGINYWSPQVPFVNVMKSSSGWISGTSSAWDDGKPLELDANGWVRSLAPGQVAKKMMLREFGNRYPAGQYVVRYKGTGVIRFAFAARTVSEKPGEIVIQVTPDDAGILMSIEQTDPANYVREIDVTLPGGICQGAPFTQVPSAASCSSDRPYLAFADHHGTLLFNPAFLDRMRSYSVLRFMDWMQTNNSFVKTWLQRTPVSYSTWATANGAPPEVMIALANVLGAHPWFTIPHQADDAYVNALAQLAKSTLSPGLRVYVEHSNEVWNTTFQQSGYVAQRGGLQYHAQRSRAIGQIFKSALGDARVVAVLGAQAANPWTARQGLDYLRQNMGTYGSLGVDAVAIAPYFGFAVDPGAAAQYTAMTLDQLFTLARSTMLPQAQAYTASYRSLAAEFNVNLIAYEGGQHLVGYMGAENDATLSTLFDAFNRDPRMKQLYLDYLQGWRREGGELFVHYTDIGRYTKWGRWGALEYLAQPRTSAPKYDALQSFIEQNPVWWTQ